MQKIIPFLWFDEEAEEAAEFYTSIFKGSEITSTARYGETHPERSGKVMTVNFRLEHQDFIALNGGPEFIFTPAISFFVTLETVAEVDALWEKLAQGGTVLMPFQKYDWSEKYGWLNDKYGVSWQIGVGDSGAQTIVPSLLFVGEQCGKAEEAIGLYSSLFDSSLTQMMKNPESANVDYAQFTLAGQTFIAMDSDEKHNFSFNEAVSLFVNCTSQTEVDELWNKLTAEGEESQCGWLKDKYGVSWQIVPTELGKLMNDPDPEKAALVTQTLMQMKKIELGVLERAYEGN